MMVSPVFKGVGLVYSNGFAGKDLCCSYGSVSTTAVTLSEPFIRARICPPFSGEIWSL